MSNFIWPKIFSVCLFYIQFYKRPLLLKPIKICNVIFSIIFPILNPFLLPSQITWYQIFSISHYECRPFKRNKNRPNPQLQFFIKYFVPSLIRHCFPQIANSTLFFVMYFDFRFPHWVFRNIHTNSLINKTIDETSKVNARF